MDEPMTPSQRIAELGLVLPDAPNPVAAYRPAVVSDGLVFVSGQIPLSDGRLTAAGSVPSALGLEDAKAAARLCALNGLAVLDSTLPGGIDSVLQIVRLGVFVCSDRDFHDQPQVANGASELMEQVFGESGRHARAAVGVIALPLGASVEVELAARVTCSRE